MRVVLLIDGDSLDDLPPGTLEGGDVVIAFPDVLGTDAHVLQETWDPNTEMRVFTEVVVVDAVHPRATRRRV